MITVMGATGNTGSKIARALLGSGERVRALGRTERKLEALARAGAATATGDAADADFLAGAFAGSDAVFTLLPTDRTAPDYRAAQDRQGEAIAAALRATGVRRVVALSSLGADRPDAPGPIAGLHAHEERLRALPDTDVLLLRPGSFFENFREALPLVRAEGVVADTVAPDLELPMVATRDVAAAAVRALAARDWRGVAVRELLGPCDLSFAAATRLLGEGIGRPDLRYVRLAHGAMVEALVAAGLAESFARLYVEMTRAFDSGSVQPLAGRNSENTTPTRFESFVDELAAEAVAA